MTVLAEPVLRLSASTTLYCDLAIVGGGIVGMTLAAALRDSGLDIVLIDSQLCDRVLNKTQAYALSVLSGRIYEGLGIWSKILPNIGKFKHIRLSDDYFPQVVTFETADLNADYLGYVAEHGAIASVLYNYLTEGDRIHWLAPVKVENIEYGEKEAILTIVGDEQRYTLKAKLTIGADGARSQIRQQAGIKTKGWKYWQSCVAFTIQHDALRNDTAFERFWKTGPMGILPLPGNRCQIVWTAPHAEAQQLYEMPVENFLTRLAAHTQGLFETVNLVGDRRLFPVQLMQSDRYIQSRLALVGDAAHCCHPVGGQGLNLGIRDAATLAQILAIAHQQGQDIGDLSVLKTYQRWRKRQNSITLGFTDVLNRLFSNDWLPAVIVRRMGLIVLHRTSPLKHLSLKLMTGLLGKPPAIAIAKME
jgi:2-octaprenyl-6-methoxyphenol hydroxylase